MTTVHEQLLASLQERQAPDDLLTREASPVLSTIVTPGTAEGLLATPATPTGPADLAPLQPLAPDVWDRGPDVRAAIRGDIPYDNPSAFKRARTKFDAPQRATRLQKGTIEQVLGEISAVPVGADGTPLGPIPDLPVGSAHDSRSGDGEPAPRPAALSLRCPICEGTGFLTLGPVTRHCGRCGGEGFVEDPTARASRTKGFHVERADGTTLLAESKAEQAVLQQAVDMEPYNRAMSAGEKALRIEAEERLEAHRRRVAEALAREAAGEQRLPLEEVSDVVVDPDRAARLAGHAGGPGVDAGPGAQEDAGGAGGPRGGSGPGLGDGTGEAGPGVEVDADEPGEAAQLGEEVEDARMEFGGVATVLGGPARGAGGLLDAVLPAQAVVEACGGPPLTYDLPEDLYALPAFCYISGPAGTGKTFQAKAWAAADPEGVTLAATTGIAAVNLGEGTTINALLRFYDTASLTDAFTGGWLESQLKRLRGAGLRRIVLDEVSMLDGDQLTILTRAIDNVNQDRGGDDAELGLVLVGDFAQLPPVKAPFAFESAEWERYQQATYGLTTIRRQADKDFVEALQAVRRGDVKRALEFFGDRLEQTTHPAFDGTTILAKNDAVAKYNQLRADKLTGPVMEFPSSRWGKLRPEWGGPPKPVHEWGVPQVLTLKEGALVMILANRNIAGPGEPPEYLYTNGDLGQVLGAEKGTLHVALQRTGEEVTVVPITRENLIPLEVGRRKALKEEGHPERVSANGKQEVIGACHYLPVRLGYATTSHKSQSLSLDRVQVNIRDHFFTQPGLLYVALSRCRTAEGLRVVGNVEGFRTRCVVSEKVRPWLS
jgi:ATP-dependent DNA helicase PIF1